jgi:hypothetical protein
MDINSDNLEKMRLGINMRFPLQMRGFNCLFRPLSIYETNLVAAETLSELRSKNKDMQNNIMENSILSIKILEKASTSDVDKTDPLVSAMELQRLTPKEIEFLYAEYVTACDKLNPRIETISADDLQALIFDCKKKQDGLELALGELSFWQVWNIALYCLTQSERPLDK